MCSNNNNKVIPSSSIPPDGGWGWVVVFASFLCNVIVDGTAYSFGVFLPKLVVSFEAGKGTVAWIGSIQACVYTASGLIASVLVNKYGSRFTCIAGSLVGMISFSLASLSNSLVVLMITLGVAGGFGLGQIHFTSIVVVGHYFDKRRALAVGITACGSGIGSFAMTPLIAFLLDHYNWKGTCLILAGIIFNCAVLGSLMRPLKSIRDEGQNKDTALNKPISINNNNDPLVKLELKDSGKIHGLKFEGDLGECDSQPSQSINKSNDSSSSGNVDLAKPLIDFTLLKNPAFSLMSVSYIFCFLAMFIPYTYIIDFSLTKGIEYNMASFLVSIIGIVNMIGRIFFGYLSDLPPIDPLTVIYTCTAITSVIIFCLPFCSNYIAFCTVATIFGLFSAPFISLSSIVLAEMLGISKMVNAFGLMSLLYGIPIILGTPLAGWIFDWTRNYEEPFWFCSGLFFLSSVLFGITSYVWRRQKRMITKCEEMKPDENKPVDLVKNGEYCAEIPISKV